MSVNIHIPVGNALPCAATIWKGTEDEHRVPFVEFNTPDVCVSLEFPTKAAAQLWAEVLAKSLASLPDDTPTGGGDA